MSYLPQFTITPALLARVETITALRERIQGASVQVAWVPALQKDTRIRNAHSSTAIEGNPLTLAEVRAVEEGTTLPLAPRSQREVLNYFAALRHIEKRVDRKKIGHDDILRLHAIMAGQVMDQGKAGTYRTIRVRVGQYFPPPPEQVSGLMFELLEWWNRDSQKLSPILSSA
ncbi:MAG: Fic family protein, partial [Nevskiales bacterium]